MKVVAFPKDAGVNPYNRLLYSQVAQLGVAVSDFELGKCPQQADVFHVHWPEFFTARRNPFPVYRTMTQWLRCLRETKLQGTKIVWTAHNVRQHEGRHRLMEEVFWSRFLPMLDGCICLSESSWKELKASRPQLNCEHTVIPHGHYRDAYPTTLSRAEARDQLALESEAFVFVNVGLIRPYKNIPKLIQVFSQTSGTDRLVIAGETFDNALANEVASLASRDERVYLQNRRVDEQQMQVFYRAADLAVLPFRNILNSGSALLALSFDVPVLVPAIGSMPELRGQVGEQWVMTYEGELSKETLDRAKSWAQTQRTDRAPLDSLDWGPIAEKTVAFYHHLSGRG